MNLPLTVAKDIVDMVAKNHGYEVSRYQTYGERCFQPIKNGIGPSHAELTMFAAWANYEAIKCNLKIAFTVINREGYAVDANNIPENTVYLIEAVVV